MDPHPTLPAGLLWAQRFKSLILPFPSSLSPWSRGQNWLRVGRAAGRTAQE